MESFRLSDSDIVIPFSKPNPNGRGDHYNIYFTHSPDWEWDAFTPPQDSIHDPILHAEFNINNERLQQIRYDEADSWKIVEIVIYSYAILIRHEHSYEANMQKDPESGIIHPGLQVSQLFAEIIDLDEIFAANPGITGFAIELISKAHEVEASWKIAVTDDKIIVNPPSGNLISSPRTHLKSNNPT